MSAFQHKVQEEKSYRRAIFLFVSLALAGVCSIYPVMCFKNYSTKERDKLDKGVKEVERHAKDIEEELFHGHHPRAFLTSPLRKSSQEVSRRRSRAISDPWRSEPVSAPVRPAAGPGASTPPSRSCSAEALPSQLLGGRAGANADVLIRKSSTSTAPESPAAIGYHIARKESAEECLRSLLAPQSASRQQFQDPDSQQKSRKSSPPETPSTSSSGQASKASDSSYASSFAYFLRNNRADRRLLKKKSQPSEHLTKHTPLSRNKPAEVRRTSSFYRPKVIEDTATPAIPSPAKRPLRKAASLSVAEFVQAAEARAPTAKDSRLTGRRPPPRSLRQSRSSHSSEGASTSTPPRLLPTLPQNAPKRPTLAKASVQQELAKLPPVVRQVRIEEPSNRPALRDRSRSRGSRERSADKPKHLSLPPPSKAEAFTDNKHFHNVTPPEAEPGSPTHSRFRHGDSYFRTFGTETMYVKEFTPTMVPTQSRDVSPMSPIVLPPPARPQLKDSPSEPTVPKFNKRKRSSIFKAFRKSALTDSTYGAPKSGIVGTRPALKNLADRPEISISPPVEPEPKRRRSQQHTTSSDILLPPYFAQAPGGDRSSDVTPSEVVSPLGTVGEPTPSQRPSYHGRLPSSRSSEGSPAVSPMTRPRSKPRLRHRATLEDMEEDVEPPGVVLWKDVDMPAATGASVETQTIRESIPSKDKRSAERTVVKTASWLSFKNQPKPTLAEKRYEAETAGTKRRSGIKRFFLDLRKPTSQPSTRSVETETPDPPTTNRRTSLTQLAQRGSMANLLQLMSKPSMNKLKGKSSQATVLAASSQATESQKSAPPSKYSLEVTDFQQTPYAQRVANTRRTEMNQVRTYVEDALNDDEDTETVLGFELDVPEHLPRSPLCPLSPKHKSGGKAICPLHGRKARPLGMARLMNSGATRVARVAKVEVKSTKPEPTIVYEGVAEGARRDSGKSAEWKERGDDASRSPGSGDGVWYS